ncbi:MAG: hypothetical protein WBL20_07810 [Sphingobium sp.]|uniref:hypothetical protein n=1 Tax=Sphingobium sp. TaxID=1912891 RepID=UPI003BB04366
MEHAFTPEEAAIVAASQASEATAELLRFIRQGAYSERAPFDVEVTGKLAEALKLSIDIEGDPAPDSILDDDERKLLTDLRDALVAFLEGWVG